MIVFAIGSTDQLFVRLDISYKAQIEFWRFGVWVIPIVVFFITRSVCRSLRRSDAHPLRDWQGTVITRRGDGAVEVIAQSPDRTESVPTEPPTGTVPGHE